jgi:hypothetical protein
MIVRQKSENIIVQSYNYGQVNWKRVPRTKGKAGWASSQARFYEF